MSLYLTKECPQLIFLRMQRTIGMSWTTKGRLDLTWGLFVDVDKIRCWMKCCLAMPLSKKMISSMVKTTLAYMLIEDGPQYASTFKLLGAHHIYLMVPWQVCLVTTLSWVDFWILLAWTRILFVRPFLQSISDEKLWMDWSNVKTNGNN